MNATLAMAHLLVEVVRTEGPVAGPEPRKVEQRVCHGCATAFASDNVRRAWRIGRAERNGRAVRQARARPTVTKRQPFEVPDASRLRAGGPGSTDGAGTGRTSDAQR